MFTGAFLFPSLMLAAAFAQAIQPAKAGTAQATRQTQQTAAQVTMSQGAVTPAVQTTAAQAAAAPELPSGQPAATQAPTKLSQLPTEGRFAAAVPAQPSKQATGAQMALLQPPSPPAAAAASATAPTGPIFAGWGTVTQWQTDWNADAILVHFSLPIIDLSCGLADTYETDPSNPGNHAQQAALLAAFLTGKSVAMEIDGCGFNQRPKIVGVWVNP
jgi:hypothetical protein